MKKIYLILLGIMCLGFANNVDAASFSISAPTSVDVNKAFTVSIIYSGSTKIGSADGNVSFSNTVCSVSSRATGAITNQSGNKIVFNLNNYEGYSNGTKIIVLSCQSSAIGTANFNTTSSNAWDVEGINQVSISNAGKNVNVTNPTTAPTAAQTTKSPKKTTAKTTPKKTTTKKTTTTIVPPINNESTTTSSTIAPTEEITENVTDSDNDDKENGYIELDEFRVIGYKLKKEKNKYILNIDEDIDEIYVLAASDDEGVTITGDGAIDIKNKNRIVVEVEKDNIISKYIIKVQKKKDNSVIIIGGLIVIIVGMLVYFLIDWKKKKSYY